MVTIIDHKKLERTRGSGSMCKPPGDKGIETTADQWALLQFLLQGRKGWPSGWGGETVPSDRHLMALGAEETYTHSEGPR
jgi:hypothetical protein